MAGRRRRIEPKWEFLSATNLAPNVISEHYADFSQKSEVGNKNKIQGKQDIKNLVQDR